ncbi:TPA: N-acetylmuramoyl-L-alanine amidase family protein, partial [Streptococcus pneumoniae]|nr:N-acetylmuramoyl-L-alanine amidase family protein [Streptococcus pneumoniae]HEW3738404.1 N-acetylmuramoyl-L-alanine amidase family protein [Streptococcus pneumoniae]
WQNLGNKWYYLRSSGAMATGWYQDGSTWYYLNAGNGDMKTGWFQVNGNWYYAYSSGALAVNTTVDGYSVNYNGEWVR